MTQWRSYCQPVPSMRPRSDSIYMSHPSCPVSTKLAVSTHDIIINNASRNESQQTFFMFLCRSSTTRKSRGIMMA